MATVVGYDNNSKSRITCKSNSSRFGCGAIVEYDERDILRYSGTDYSGGPDGRWWVKCPNCNQDITIKSW